MPKGIYKRKDTRSDKGAKHTNPKREGRLKAILSLGKDFPDGFTVIDLTERVIALERLTKRSTRTVKAYMHLMLRDLREEGKCTMAGGRGAKKTLHKLVLDKWV